MSEADITRERKIDPFKDPICLTYGELLIRHLSAVRQKRGSPRQEKLYNLINEMRLEFPAEAAAWEFAHTPKEDHPAEPLDA